MSPNGVVYMTWLPLVMRLPLVFAHRIQPKVLPATERHALPTSGGGQVSQFLSNRKFGKRPDKVRIKRAMEIADRDDLQHAFGEHSGGQLHLLLAAIGDEAEHLQSKRSRTTRDDGAVSRTFERVHRRARQRTYGEAMQFKHLERTGVWCVADPLGGQIYRWTNLAQGANLSLGFRVRDFQIHGKRIRNLLTFGMHLDRLNYALPCTDLRWDGQSWSGPMRRNAYMGTGVVVMGAFLQAIAQNVTNMEANGGSLQCFLTADDAENPQEMVWQIVGSGGEAVIRMKLRRAPMSREGLLGRPLWSSGEVAYFNRFAKTGAWRASDPLAPRDHRWIQLAHVANLSLGFRIRDFRSNGLRAYRALTFGMQLDSANYALPCADLRWDGQSWRGPITPASRRGSGGAVMGAFLQSIEQSLTEMTADGTSLQCVLTADDVANPQEMVWQIVCSGGEAVTRIKLERARTSREGVLGRPRLSSGEEAFFKRFAKTGAWRVSDALAPQDTFWLNFAYVANLSLGFRIRDVQINGLRVYGGLTFGMQSDGANYALPCAHLRWDGQSWRGPITPAARRGRGGAVMDAVLQAIGQ